MHRALYPGTFDPVTNGHLDIIQRASRLFDEVVIGVAWSEKKSPLFSLEERMSLCQEVCVDLDNVKVKSFTGLLVNFAQEQEANVLIRGIRSAADFEYEMQLTNMNRDMYPDLETVFVTTAPSLNHISGSLVREIATMGGDIAQFVPTSVATALTAKC